MKTTSFALSLAVVTAFSISAQAQQNDPCAYLVRQQSNKGEFAKNLGYIGAAIVGEAANRYGYSQAGYIAQTAIQGKQEVDMNHDSNQTSRYQTCTSAQSQNL